MQANIEAVIMGEREKTIEYRFFEARAPKARSVAVRAGECRKATMRRRRARVLKTVANKNNLISLLGGISKRS